MRSQLGQEVLSRLTAAGQRRRMQTLGTLALVGLGPLLVAATFAVLGPMQVDASVFSLRLVLLSDLVYILVLATLVLMRIARMVAARRAKSAGSRLHLRLTGVFALVALVPTVLVAVFAGLTVNVGLEGWFSDRVRSVVGASLAAAEAYETEQQEDLTVDTRALTAFLNAQRRRTFLMTNGDFRQILGQGQSQIQRGLKEAYVIDGNAGIRARGEGSYLFYYEPPTADELARARAGEIVIRKDWDNDEFRALSVLDAFVDRYLLVARSVDGDLLNLLDDTQQTATLYQQLERDRGRMLFEFGLLYLGFAVMLILASIWLGLWFAERLARPVGRLAGAAQRVGDGDLNVQVREERGDDEIAVLGRIFNQMILQLRGQRQTLLDANQQIETRRRLFDSVLSSVTAGVMGLDASGRVDFINTSGLRLLALTEGQGPGLPLAELVPEFTGLLARLRTSDDNSVQEEIKLSRGGVQDILLVRMGMRQGRDGTLEGFVVAFDDVTDLVSAQRMAAWGDVARRIAHEIKNPLTPIQLSAERIQRKFGPLVGDDVEKLDQLTGVIVRQTGDLRRIVDEFSKFARMPEPEAREGDLCKLVADAVFLQSTGSEDVKVTTDLPTDPIMADFDATLFSQAVINLVKNAIEAAQSRVPDGGAQAQVHVALIQRTRGIRLTVDDTGPGFPPDRARLFEPYVTTRDRGTGLGLPIVKKIVEEHGGKIKLESAPDLAGDGHRGARVSVTLPRASSTLKAAE
ncbi:sensor histidine kinase NtrY-like [Meridianimarinicoccus aquatilis]|uniref:histidine kinase n=1 Tax=Meridianimarinicoccus aquatilis TaxID=2552766 RepID=A0A4R6B5B8_9RHOB|nr:PAS domain-containing sensor histidine kinase [Fluviibacterium aquatile]QIE42364.1 PAS domain-containing sensor histidine kinase [Rhodobacteraceae bacterium SC52]TDL91238.1 PAS domain-containing sensor histidine kinase [Fluviibacterium aquatile]